MDRLAENAWVAVERLFPETIRQHDRARCIGAVVGCGKQAAEDWAQAHDFKVVAIDDASRNLARGAEADEGEVERGKAAKFGDGFEIFAEVVDFGDGALCRR